MRILLNKQYNTMYWNELQAKNRAKQAEAYLEYKDLIIKSQKDEIKDLKETNLTLQKNIIDLRKDLESVWKGNYELQKKKNKK